MKILIEDHYSVRMVTIVEFFEINVGSRWIRQDVFYVY
jgi:hypothetical protein